MRRRVALCVDIADVRRWSVALSCSSWKKRCHQAAESFLLIAPPSQAFGLNGWFCPTETDMNTIDRADLRTLIEDTNEPTISIYMPLDSGADSRQNAARLKNLTRTAEEKLVASGMRTPEARQVLAGVHDYFDRSAAGESLGKSLAVLISQQTRIWHLPVACRECCEVGQNYYVLPLIAALADDVAYFVLALSQNQVRLLRSTRHQIEQIDVPDLPPSRAAALQLDEPEPAMQAHVGRAQVPGKGDLMFHGHGGAPENAKDEIRLFLQAVDRSVSQHLRQQIEPLVFAGVDYLFAMYQQVNTYRHLVPAAIIGNPELWAPAEIREKAWPLIEPLCESRRESALLRYGDLVGQDRAIDRIDDILLAAHNGAVETLFVDPSHELRGQFILETGAVRIEDSPDAYGENLINLAAILVLRSSGVVEPLAPGEVPGRGPLAAMLRYPSHAALPAGSRAP
jgi:hypothetical protein